MGGAASSQTPVSASAVGTTGLSKGYMEAQVKEWEAQMAMVGSQAETVAVETKEETPEEETSPVKVGYMDAQVKEWETQRAIVGSQAESAAIETKEETSPVKVGYMAGEVRAWEEAQKQAAIGNCACCDNKNYGSDSEDEEY